MYFYSMYLFYVFLFLYFFLMLNFKSSHNKVRRLKAPIEMQTARRLLAGSSFSNNAKKGTIKAMAQP